MTNTVSDRTREVWASSSMVEGALVFMTVYHPTLPEPLRFVSDMVDYERSGLLWKGIPFEWQWVSDDDKETRSEVSIPNVDRLIGEHLLSADERVRVDLELLTTAGFRSEDPVTGEVLNPRRENGVAEVQIACRELSLEKVTISPLTVSGTIGRASVLREPFPPERATRNRCPGLFK